MQHPLFEIDKLLMMKMTSKTCVSPASAFPAFLPAFIFAFLLFSLGCASTPPVDENDFAEGTTVNEYGLEQHSVQEAEQKDSNIGLLWEVSKPDETTSSYIFGTIHSEDARVTELPEPVNDAFNQASHLALEILLDDNTTRVVLKALYFNDGRKLKSFVSADTYSRAISAMALRGLEESITNKMKPWAVFTILSMPEQKTGLFLDALLYQNAQKQEKTITGLETPEEQTAVFNEMSIDSQVSLLESTLDHQADMSDLLNDVIEVYLTRDLDQILAINEQYETLIDETLAKEFNQRLITDRNYRMVERMLPIIDKGDSFIAIGALHLPGEEGILNLLFQQGYEIQAIY